MVLQSLAGHLLILGAGAPVVAVGVDADAAAGGEEAGYLDVLGLHEADEVFHDDVDAIFVKGPVVAETEEVELEALALDHAFAGNVVDLYGGEVGLPGDGAEAGKLGAIEAHPVVVFGVFVGEGFQHLGGIVLPIGSLMSQQSKLRFFRFHRVEVIVNLLS